VLNIQDKIKGCIITGAIGDAYGSYYENIEKKNDTSTFYPFGRPVIEEHKWQITDDTQLTLATCEAITENPSYLNPEKFADKFLEYYKKGKITGIGASTLKALRELEVGGHWYLVGRSGEYAAGNGAAMRIAPIAFCKDISNQTIKDICSITHKNDEAYIGALSIVIAIRSVLSGEWSGKENLLEIIIDRIPDTKIRDRLIEINKIQHTSDLIDIGRFGNNGYVVNSVPLALAAANKIQKIGLKGIFNRLIQIGGDTDTNCSLAGQICGTLLGIQNIPEELLNNLKQINEYDWIVNTVNKFINKVQTFKNQ
jgi:ADP-ribosylglycohydrolase